MDYIENLQKVFFMGAAKEVEDYGMANLSNKWATFSNNK